jgi:hypothetical protein
VTHPKLVLQKVFEGINPIMASLDQLFQAKVALEVLNMTALEKLDLVGETAT